MTHVGRAAAFAALVLLAAMPARAQSNIDSRGIELVPNQPSPFARSAITLDGALAAPVGTLRGEGLVDTNSQILSLSLGDQKLGNLVPYRVDVHLIFSWTPLSFLEVAADLPFTLVQGSNFGELDAAGLDVPGINTAGLNDLRILPRVFLLNAEKAPFGAALSLETRFPTGNTQSFMGANTVVFAPRLALERALGPVRMLLNAGLVLQGAGQFINLYVQDQLMLGGGLIFQFNDFGAFHEFQLMAETVTYTPLQTPFTSTTSTPTPWEVLVGVRTRIGKMFGAELDFGRGVTSSPGYGREAFRVIAAFRVDVEPQPKAAVPAPPSDRDHDGIPDELDKCPDEPGPKENDGCPDVDTDGDGVPDRLDACPREPGSREMDGCPDRDGDQIPDREDKCPDEPGPAENDGCPVVGEPLVQLETKQIRIRGSVLFDTGMATILSQSYPLLDEVVQVLKDNPTIGPVRIEGNTDSRGGREYNLDLSERRARAVLDYLVKHGIKRSRLRTIGYGFDHPVATNETALGRAKNRRVEFRLLGPDGQELQDTPLPPAGKAPAPASPKAPEPAPFPSPPAKTP
ncbi:MAG: OmpA family protein [Myxococcaceae bacterium]